MTQFLLDRVHLWEQVLAGREALRKLGWADYAEFLNEETIKAFIAKTLDGIDQTKLEGVTLA